MVHDALLSRLSNDDDIEAGLSTFAAEMRTYACRSLLRARLTSLL